MRKGEERGLATNNCSPLDIVVCVDMRQSLGGVWNITRRRVIYVIWGDRMSSYAEEYLKKSQGCHVL